MSHAHHGSSDVAVLDGAMRFALVGNPNAGKSTLFNALTGLNTKVANYPGATVSRHVGTMRVGDQNVSLEDLPGTYSLDPISPDEKIVTDVLEGDQSPDALLVLLDATSLRRSLGLVAQVQRLGLPALLVVTFADELARRGGAIDLAALSQATGQQVLSVTAGHKLQLAQLRDAMAHVDQWPSPVIPAPTSPERVSDWITSVLDAAGYRMPDPDERTRKIDAVLLHPVWGTLIFFATMLLFFQVVFTVAAPLQGWIESGFAWLGGLARSAIGIDWLASLVADGLIGGVGAVLAFVPQIALLFLMVSLLEGTGYMARAAFLMDLLMGRAGLEGRAFVAMLSGLACAIPGIMATRALPSARDRLATMMTVPLMTCSARLPVYTLLIGLLVPSEKHWGPIGLQGLVLFALYLAGAVAAMTSAWIFQHLFGGKGQSLPFYMEMPSYRIPTLQSILIAVWDAVKSFLSKIARVILVLTVVMWALLNLPMHSESEIAAAGVDMQDSAAVATWQLDHSYAAGVGKAIQPVFQPLGFDWRMSVSIVASLGAREVFVATLGQIASAEDPENPAAAVSEMTWTDGPHAGDPLFTPGTVTALLLFFIFALQCTSTIATLRRESGSWKWPALAFGYMFSLAWLAGWLGKLVVDGLV